MHPVTAPPLVAQCSNCTSWQTTPDFGHATAAEQGFCGKGLYPDAGKPLCQKYEATNKFRQEIISRMLIEGGPMAMPVKLVGGRKSAAEHNKKLKRASKR